MNALTKTEGGALSTIDRAALVNTLRNSLYPGAKPASVEMVLDYCAAAKLDPLQKPVHIVPMSVKDKATNNWVEVDQIMPGIGLYRVQAARTGEYAGQDEPVLGPMATKKLGNVEVEFPEWCSVTVYRMIGGVRCPFTAKEYWLENYATKSKDSREPNAMWSRRKVGQIAKCAEAQALRKAFPEIGSAPTAEEMEGHVWAEDAESTNAEPRTIKTPRPAAAPAASTVIDNETGNVVGAEPPPPPPPEQTPGTIGPGEVKWVTRKFDSFQVPPEARAATLARHGITELEKATPEQFAGLKSELSKL